MEPRTDPGPSWYLFRLGPPLTIGSPDLCVGCTSALQNIQSSIFPISIGIRTSNMAYRFNVKNVSNNKERNIMRHQIQLIRAKHIVFVKSKKMVRSLLKMNIGKIN